MLCKNGAPYQRRAAPTRTGRNANEDMTEDVAHAEPTAAEDSQVRGLQVEPAKTKQVKEGSVARRWATCGRTVPKPCCARSWCAMSVKAWCEICSDDTEKFESANTTTNDDLGVKTRDAWESESQHFGAPLFQRGKYVRHEMDQLAQRHRLYKGTKQRGQIHTRSVKRGAPRFELRYEYYVDGSTGGRWRIRATSKWTFTLEHMGVVTSAHVAPEPAADARTAGSGGCQRHRDRSG